MTYEEAVAVINLMGLRLEVWETNPTRGGGHWYSDVFGCDGERVRNSAAYATKGEAKMAFIRWVEGGAEPVNYQKDDLETYGQGLRGKT